MEENSAQQPNLDQDAHNQWLSSLSKAKMLELSEKLNDLQLKKEQTASSQPESEIASSSPKSLSGIDRAVQRHKGLTRSEAQEMADEFGF